MQIEVRIPMGRLFLILASALACLGTQSDEALWERTFVDITGEKHQQTMPDTRVVVWIFILEDCPISNAYMPEINRMVSSYSEKGVRFVLVHCNPDLTREQALEHMNAYRIKATVIMDPKMDWARRAGATVTPEVAVFDGEGSRLYLGRVDDRFPEYGKRRAAPTRTELKDALDHLLAGKPVAVPKTQAIGCYIPFPVEKAATP